MSMMMVVVEVMMKLTMMNIMSIGLTVIVTLLHSVFDFLAFRNDVQVSAAQTTASLS